MTFATTRPDVVFLAMSVVLCVLAIRWRQTASREAHARHGAELAEAKLRHVLETVKAEKECLSLVLSTMHEEVYFINHEGKYTFANPTALREFSGIPVVGLEAKELVEQLVILRPDGTPRPHAETPPLRALAGEVISGEEQIVLTPRTGELRNRLISAAPARDSSGKIIGAVSTVRDITSLKQVEASLRDADQRKNVFLATLAHELRNPLAPIRAAAHVLSSAQSAEDLERCQAVISRQVGQMASLLDDLLDVSRFSRGELTLKKSPTPLEDILDAGVEAAQPLIAAKQHALHLEMPPCPVTVEVDAVRLTQIVSNLLNNAAKYTDTGGEISLGVHITDAGLVLAVRDSGIGLSAEDQRRIFEMFVQVEAAADRADGGLGIGLALVRVLVELHGGKIEVSSAGPGLGSTFTVTLPRAVLVQGAAPESAADRQTARQVAARPVRTADSRRVLVADDNADGVQTLQMLLQYAGHEVHVAYDGAQAMDVAARVQPEVAIIDIGMPGLSGYDVAARIRREAWGRHITLVALTGWGQNDDRLRALSAGFDHHLTKPADPDRLDELMAETRRAPSRGSTGC